jgi:hypothetical protein
LQSGFIPNAIGFSSFVDLRPDFGDGEEISGINGYLPIIQLRITTDSANPQEKQVVLQVNEEALKELHKALKRAESKIAASIALLKNEPNHV